MSIDFSTFYNVIDGKLRGAAKTYCSINPATGEQLWPVPVATKADLEDAVTAGQTAFRKWSQTPLEQRKDAMRRFAQALLDHQSEMAAIVVKETGTPAFVTQFETTSGSATLTAHGDYQLPIHTIQDDENVTITIYYEPMGVVGAICPWNFPLALSIKKIAPALFMGNTVIVKPSPFTPYSTLKMVEIAQRFFPPGVVQALGGDDQLGPWIVDHPGIPKITFTGSSATGKKVQAAAAKHLKRTTLELGGNDPAIVFPDADIESAAKGLAMGAFINTGQVCLAIKRIFIHRSIYTSFLPALSAAIQALPVGDPTNPQTMIGPLQNRMQYDKVRSLRAASASAGHTFYLDGLTHPSAAEASGNGLFLTPSLLSEPPLDSDIMVKEQFGPLLPTQPWDDLDAVIAAANNTGYGLGASLWTRDLEMAAKVARKLEAGSVWVNDHAGIYQPASLVGAKDSGIGIEGGELGLASYGQGKAVYLPKKAPGMMKGGINGVEVTG